MVVEVAVCAERVRTTTDENGGLPLTTTDVHVGCELRSNNEQPAKRPLGVQFRGSSFGGDVIYSMFMHVQYLLICLSI